MELYKTPIFQAEKSTTELEGAARADEQRIGDPVPVGNLAVGRTVACKGQQLGRGRW